MISEREMEALSEGWIKEFSVDPYKVKEREMVFWHELDILIYGVPLDALKVFDRIATMHPIDWTIEGLAVGPLRTFLMLHDGKYDTEITKIRSENAIFESMYAMALEGL